MFIAGRIDTYIHWGLEPLLQPKRAGKETNGQNHLSERSRYEGGVMNEKPHGSGRIEEKDGTIFIGQFRHGMKHGYGRETHRNGDWLESEFRLDQLFRNAKARKTLETGEICEGEVNQEGHFLAK